MAVLVNVNNNGKSTTNSGVNYCIKKNSKNNNIKNRKNITDNVTLYITINNEMFSYTLQPRVDNDSKGKDKNKNTTDNEIVSNNLQSNSVSIYIKDESNIVLNNTIYNYDEDKSNIVVNDEYENNNEDENNEDDDD